VVLLDEYQDTSVIQTQLLAAVFRDAAVMAVGDPQQSIYGWRGASADNLSAFPRAFSSSGEAQRFRLMISWRNDTRVLTAANALLAPTGAADGDILSPRPGATDGRVTAVFADTVEDEAREVAEWFASRRSEHAASGAPTPHSGAVLFRTKRHMTLFAEALDAVGVPNRILGLGGLLSTPEVVDVISALRVVHDPAQGSALIRLLAGPRFAVGVADLAGLHALADTLTRRDGSLAPLPPELAARVRGSAGADEQLSIIDALEFVRRAPDDHRFLREITETGRARLRDAAEMFARLRRAVGQPIPDLIRLIELELRLDIELAANEARGPARVASARLRTFLDEVRAFLLADDRGSVGNLLAWLDHAEETDELMPRPEPPEPGVVQLLTIHGSKGLEWDAVAVPRLVDKELPKAPRTVSGWLSFGVLPYPMRGDRAALPELDWRHVDDDDDLPAAIEAFREADRAHQEREERRLAYVAVTRARGHLLLSGSHWAGQKDPRGPSRYLSEMIDALGLPAIDDPPSDENPYLDRGGRIVSWPLDPLGARRDVVKGAADEVAEAAAGEQPEPDTALERLLVELQARRRGVPVRAPARIPASRFKDYITDFAGTVASVVRPLPERPYRQTRLGTLFHAWVEQRSGRAGSAASLDDALWELDDDPDTEASAADAADLAKLRAVFEASEWAPLAPIEVETEIDFVLRTPNGESHVIICKLDAVYRRDDRGRRIEIVDWKTGRPPRGSAQSDERMLQLALYRLAYHRRHGVPLADIDVALYYVADDLVIRSNDILDEQTLAERWMRAARGNSSR
jgi:DNA helicase-2/ATP-dependent DNA helicase PcrA